jgi:hypothetical protein
MLWTPVFYRDTQMRAQKMKGTYKNSARARAPATKTWPSSSSSTPQQRCPLSSPAESIPWQSLISPLSNKNLNHSKPNSKTFWDVERLIEKRGQQFVYLSGSLILQREGDIVDPRVVIKTSSQFSKQHSMSLPFSNTKKP